MDTLSGHEVNYDDVHQHFTGGPDCDVERMCHTMTHPISVILQITRRCNQNCVFCSETEPIPDPSAAMLAKMRDNLHGVSRVFLSGGEPLLRDDILDVLGLFMEGFLVGIPTNATTRTSLIPQLVGKVCSINVGIEGPRAITARVRGDYDRVISGLFRFREAHIPLSITSVVMRSTVEGLPYVVQMADLLDVGKVKLVTPIKKGNALLLPDSEWLSHGDAAATFVHLVGLRERFGWRPELRMTMWTDANEGYSILVFPDGRTHAWPVYNLPDCVYYLGNLLEDNIRTLWERYPFKRNHITKYLGHSILTCH